MDALYGIKTVSSDTQFISLACTYSLLSVLAFVLVSKFLDPISR